MISYEQALQIILSQCVPQQSERIEVKHSLNRVCASPLASTENLPPFDNTAMDGFALNCNGASLAEAEEFDVSGQQAAGDVHSELKTGALEIMTGARMPGGADSVIPVEQVSILKADANGAPLRIRLNETVRSGQHVRRAGEDVRVGDILIEAGSQISDRHLMLLSAVGVASIKVRKTVQASVLCTGRELVSDPNKALASGEIRNSNGPYLASALPQMQVHVAQLESIADDIDDFICACTHAVESGSQIIISTGAVSMGAFDFVPEALKRMGATTHFHKVQIRPGKPVLFASLPNGSLFFGLPGNPVSTAVGLRFFVEPAVHALYGMPAETKLTLPLLNAATKRSEFRFFQKARVELAASGSLGVRLIKGQESFRIQPFVHSNAWIELPEGKSDFAEGELVNVFGWRAQRYEVSESCT